MTCKNLNDPKTYGQYKKTMHHFGLDFGGKAGRLLGLQILRGTNRCKTIHKTNVYFFIYFFSVMISAAISHLWVPK